MDPASDPFHGHQAKHRSRDPGTQALLGPFGPGPCPLPDDTDQLNSDTDEPVHLGKRGLMTQMTQVGRTVQAGMPGRTWPPVIWRRAVIAWPSHTAYWPPPSARTVWVAGSGHGASRRSYSHELKQVKSVHQMRFPLDFSAADRRAGLRLRSASVSEGLSRCAGRARKRPSGP